MYFNYDTVIIRAVITPLCIMTTFTCHLNDTFTSYNNLHDVCVWICFFSHYLLLNLLLYFLHVFLTKTQDGIAIKMLK